MSCVKREAVVKAPKRQPRKKEHAMPKQEQVQQGSTPTGQDKGAARTDDSQSQDDRGEGTGKIGLTSDSQPDLVAPSGLNERDHGAADDKPMGGGSINFDDDDMVHPRGKTTSAGGTWKAQGGDSAPLGPPGAGLSDRNGPSDRGSKR
jgi:hypothetical protein